MKKIILILLVCISIDISAQIDIRTDNQYVVISSIDTLLLAEYMESTRIETAQDVLVIETLDSIEIGILPLYDSVDFFEVNKLYNYNGQAIHCLQSHNRTIYLPEQVPALFVMYRQNSDTLTWIAGEKVVVGWIRVYNDNNYECLQSHMTITGWPPDSTPSLWTLVTEGCPEWVQPTGAHDAFNIGDCVTFEGLEYESLINANVWSPLVYPAGWQLK